MHAREDPRQEARELVALEFYGRRLHALVQTLRAGAGLEVDAPIGWYLQPKLEPPIREVRRRDALDLLVLRRLEREDLQRAAGEGLERPQAPLLLPTQSL